jgi:Cdc6-like AAA superfamily ATPase
MALNMKHIDTIFLLSDGAPGAGKFTSPADILREAKKINQLRRITIHCISIGTDSQLLKDLAAQNSGKYVRR